jgi:hypothetical protein
MDGISIDFNLVEEIADSPIRSNRDPLAKVTDSSDLHREKLDLPKTISDDGILIDFNPLT